MTALEHKHLDWWATQPCSRSGLPELLHRLLAREQVVNRLWLPTADPTRYRSYDGIVSAGAGAVRVPAGLSYWEAGVTENPLTKANGDYQARLAKDGGANQKASIFVFVTPRLWPGAETWAQERRAEGGWKDVWVIEQSALYQWIEEHPRVALWFKATQLGWETAQHEWVEPKRNWQPRALHKDRPVLGWLGWKARLTPLIGRGREFTDLKTWALGEPGAAFRLLTGVGGAGKTRLALELAEELATQHPGWAAGVVPADQPLPLDAGSQGCLLIIDYPEENRDAVGQRLREFAEFPDDGTIRRLLLLTRKDADYWQPAINRAGAESCEDRAYALSDRLSADDGWALFTAAMARTRDLLGVETLPAVARDEFDVWLSRVEANHRPLLVVAAAIEAVQTPDRPILSLSAAEIIAALAQREITRLSRLSTAHGFAEDGLPRLAALAVVRGGLDAAVLERLAEPSVKLGLEGTGNGDLIDRLARTGCLTRGHLDAPVPDIVGAALLMLVLEKRADRAPDWLWAVLADNPAAGLARLERITDDVSMVLGWGKRGLSGWLAAMVDGAPERALPLIAPVSDAQLPQGLVPMAITVWRTLLSQDDIPLGERAEWQNNLSVHLSDMGETAAALTAIREAVGLYRALAQEHPARYRPDLASSLNNYSTCLYGVGETAAALTAIREAVGLYRALAQEHPARDHPDLAMSLNNYSTCLDGVGETAAALTAIREAVGLYRALAQEHPARYRPDLAMSLNNYSNRLDGVGETAAALTAIREAVEIRRALAQEHPARYRPALAGSLANLCLRLEGSDDVPGALAAIEEALALIEPAATAYPNSQAGQWQKMMQRDRARFLGKFSS